MKLSILCFGDYWDTLWRRRQQLMAQLAQREQIERIIWVEQPLTLLSLRSIFAKTHDEDAYSRWRRVFSSRSLRWTFSEKIQIVTPVSLMPYQDWGPAFRLDRRVREIVHLRLLRQALDSTPASRLVVWVSHPFLPIDLLRSLDYRLLWYDCTEDFSAIGSLTPRIRALLKQNDAFLTQRAQVVSTVSHELYRRKAQEHSRVVLLPNAVDIEVFASIQDRPPPDAIADMGHPLLLFIGGSAEDQDWGLLEAIAHAHPEWSVLLIGFDILPSEAQRVLKRCPPIRSIGRVPYDQLPAYLAHADACLQLYLPSDFNATRNPQKLFLYLASGKPIVSTKTADAEAFQDLIYTADSPSEFIAHLEKALKREPDELSLRRQAMAEHNSWKARADQILAELNVVLNTPAQTPHLYS